MKQTLSLESVQALHQAGKLAEAKDGYLALLKINPRDGHLLHALSILSAQERHFKDAVDYIERALTLQPDNLTFQLHLANFYKAQGSYDQATTLLLDIIKKDKDAAPAYNNLGTIFHLTNQMEKSISAYKEAIKLTPNYIDAYYNLGLAQLKSNQYEAAAATFQKLLSLSKDHFAARFHLANTYMQQENFSQAEKEFLTIEENHPFHFETQANLATCFLKQGGLKPAKDHYKKALEIKPDDLQVLYNLGIITTQEGLLDEAIQYYQRAIQVNPDYFEVHNNLGVAFIGKQHPEFALKHFKEALRLQPQNKAIAYTVEALSKQSRLLTAPPDYITTLFDAYADHYDSHLLDALDYKVPQLLFAAVSEHTDPSNKTILDLGCGTGLCAEPFKHSKKIIGVDLSAKMLALAKAKNIYAELIQSDLIAYLETQINAFDIILAGDVFVYMGNLSPLFSLCAEALKPEGLMVFNTEINDESDFKINQSGRFQHNLDYIKNLSASNHLAILSYKEVQTRMQNGIPLIGRVYVLQKKGVVE